MARRGSSKPGQDYIKHLRSEAFPGLRKIPGFVDGSILSRQVSGGVEFLIVTRWDSLDAIAKFAAADIEAAVVTPEGAAMMIDYDQRVRHYEVLG